MSKVSARKWAARHLAQADRQRTALIAERKRLLDTRQLIEAHTRHHEHNLQHPGIVECDCVIARRVRSVLESLKRGDNQ